MFELKPLSREAIPGALAKVERYRLLNEPFQAESICRDILAIDPTNQTALVMLVLALTDQFDHGISAQEALADVARLESEYERAYYTGIVHERRALAMFRHSDFRSPQAVFALVHQAMECYQEAHSLRRAGNDDSVLRWNACARFLNRTPHLSPARQPEDPVLSE